MDEKIVATKELVQLARLALLGNRPDIQLFVRRLANRYKSSMPEIASELGSLLKAASDTPETSILRRSTDSYSEEPTPFAPTDKDSRLPLIRIEQIDKLSHDPIWTYSVQTRLEQIVQERKMSIELSRSGLSPTRSALFTGAPGVGKTLAAKWMAHQLKKPLFTLDLSAVMSSFLGKTGMNVRSVLDYARVSDCVLLLDEFDSIAKRRDDAVEVGELKRLVTVLLQEIDDWPSSGLLLAATNHPELLDPAVWRRFDMIIEFPMPDENGAHEAVQRWLDSSANEAVYAAAITRLLKGLSFSEIDRELARAKRSSIVHGYSQKESLRNMVLERAENLSRNEKTHLAKDLIELGFSQHQAHEWTGVSRDTIRKHTGKTISKE